MRMQVDQEVLARNLGKLMGAQLVDDLMSRPISEILCRIEELGGPEIKARAIEAQEMAARMLAKIREYESETGTVMVDSVFWDVRHKVWNSKASVLGQIERGRSVKS